MAYLATPQPVWRMVVEGMADQLAADLAAHTARLADVTISGAENVVVVHAKPVGDRMAATWSAVSTLASLWAVEVCDATVGLEVHLERVSITTTGATMAAVVEGLDERDWRKRAQASLVPSP